MEQYAIYRFYAADIEKIEVRLDFDAITLQLLPVDGQPTPSWARLDHHPCPHCPLSADSVFCPSALGIARFIGAFDSRFSYQKAVVEVETPLRVVLSKSRFQAGMASLFGLVCATSGCPATQFLRPLARFHQPWADEQEALFRVFSAHLLSIHMKNVANASADRQSLDEVRAHYAALSRVLANLGERLRPVVKRYAPLNAAILLDSLALIAPLNIEERFAELQSLCDL
jgi:hypothetical protein